MRIKLFETFETNDYYQEVSMDEWNYFTPLMITKSNIDKIMKILPCEKMLVPLEKSNCGAEYSYLRYKGEKIKIYESEDEYFYVCYFDPNQFAGLNLNLRSHGVYYYKCDQFEGLVKFLKDKGIII
jgi:hypothetical protein